MEKSQREYYLNEQVKAIQKELGDGEDQAEIEELSKKIKAAGMTKEALEKANGELKKLKMMSPMSAEATVVRNYLDVLTGLPWKKKSKVSKDLRRAIEVLEADHYGLEKVKERITEYLAVHQRVDKVKAPILCLVDTAVPTLARCPVKCCKTCRRLACAIHCSCLMRSIRWVRTSVVILRPRS
jgi:ATP-dependent Lon protease